MAAPTLLVVDDEKLIRWTLRQHLEEAGYRVLEAEDGATATAQLGDDVDLVLLDMKLPDTDGLTLLRKFRETSADTIVILMTAYSTVKSVVEAMKEGAFHYVNKPLDMDELLILVEKALETTELKREIKGLRASQSEPWSFDRIIGRSPAMETTKALLRKIAASPASTVLLTGESGTGKDLAAKVIHYNSNRSHRMFQNITCSALPETLLESELFGHEKGAFTDAKGQKKGLFEQADGGTVFLDEIGEMTPKLQAKLLRFLEEKSFRRVGGSGDVQVDVRIIAATNRDLEDEVGRGGFREDLFYRLKVMPIHLPPLRERREDIAPLVHFYLESFAREFKKNVREVSPEAMEALSAYRWPGNVRELRNAVERAVLLTERESVGLEEFPSFSTTRSVATGFQLPPEGVDLEQLERQLVRQAIERTKGNQTKAAQLLGLNRDQIRYRLEKFALLTAEGAKAKAE